MLRVLSAGAACDFFSARYALRLLLPAAADCLLPPWMPPLTLFADMLRLIAAAHMRAARHIRRDTPFSYAADTMIRCAHTPCRYYSARYCFASDSSMLSLLPRWLLIARRFTLTAAVSPFTPPPCRRCAAPQDAVAARRRRYAAVTLLRCAADAAATLPMTLLSCHYNS